MVSLTPVSGVDLVLLITSDIALMQSPMMSTAPVPVFAFDTKLSPPSATCPASEVCSVSSMPFSNDLPCRSSVVVSGIAVTLALLSFPCRSCSAPLSDEPIAELAIFDAIRVLSRFTLVAAAGAGAGVDFFPLKTIRTFFCFLIKVCVEGDRVPASAGEALGFTLPGALSLLGVTWEAGVPFSESPGPCSTRTQVQKS